MKVLAFFLLNLSFFHKGFCTKTINHRNVMRELSIGVTSECGISNNDNTRIINGYETEFHEFPWIVSIQEIKNKYSASSNGHICGGSIVHPSWVITAADCFDKEDMDNLRIVAGRNNLDKPEDYDQIRYINDYFLNDYDRKFHTNDIALIRLDKDLELNEVTVAPICLPDINEKFDTNRIILAGYGSKTPGYQIIYEGPVHKAALSTIPLKECQGFYEKDQNTTYISDCHLCTAPSKRAACDGDFGGPAMANDGKKYILWGIIGMIIDCGFGDFPNAYTDVTCYVDWIKETINNN